MKYKLLGTRRALVAYSKIPDEDGDNVMLFEYPLNNIKLSDLQKIFNIAPNDPDFEMLDCYRIREEHVPKLKPFLSQGEIDLEKYIFNVECFGIYDWNNKK